METIAYYIALWTTLSMPAGILFWFFIHPLAHWWRKWQLHPVVYYLLITFYLLACMSVMFLFREPLLRVHFGVKWSLSILSLFLLVGGIIVASRRWRMLTISAMLGVPEISAVGPGKLVTEGIYSQVRNPRYIEIGLMFSALALFCNYLVVYVLLAIYIPIIYLVVLLEERELRDRFGEEFVQYCRRVPRFVPKLRKNRHTSD